MTTYYTADDFKRAEFARHPDGYRASRREGGGIYAWVTDRQAGLTMRSDNHMANAGWVPVFTVHAVEDDERVKAWEELAEHPAWEKCYADERPLIEAMMDRLTQLRETEQAVTELAQGDKNPRSLTPDVITDGMVDRACRRLRDIDDDGISLRGTWTAREVIIAALSEPPARPEGAEELEAILAELPDTTLPITDAGRADLLASRGVRVVGSES